MAVGSTTVILMAYITTPHSILKKAMALTGREACRLIRYMCPALFQDFLPNALATLKILTWHARMVKPITNNGLRHWGLASSLNWSLLRHSTNGMKAVSSSLL